MATQAAQQGDPKNSSKRRRQRKKKFGHGGSCDLAGRCKLTTRQACPVGGNETDRDRTWQDWAGTLRRRWLPSVLAWCLTWPYLVPVERPLTFTFTLPKRCWRGGGGGSDPSAQGFRAHAPLLPLDPWTGGRVREAAPARQSKSSERKTTLRYGDGVAACTSHEYSYLAAPWP